jgi:hypothetical protein
MSSEAVGNPSTECKVHAFAVLKIKKHFRERKKEFQLVR